jgi:hypothetical protein
MKIYLENGLTWGVTHKGKVLLTSIPGYSTHGESAWLSPLTNWELI